MRIVFSESPTGPVLDIASPLRSLPSPIAVRVVASTKELGEAQAASVSGYLLRELMLTQKNVSADAARVPYPEQRVEVVLLNR